MLSNNYEKRTLITIPMKVTKEYVDKSGKL